MAYADYTYYSGRFLGSLVPQGRFDAYARKAGAYLDQVTGGGAAAYTASDAVKDACCAVAEAYYENDQGGGVASERAGEHAVSYVIGISKSLSPSQRLYAAACLYLAETGLLFRGVGE